MKEYYFYDRPTPSLSSLLCAVIYMYELYENPCHCLTRLHGGRTGTLFTFVRSLQCPPLACLQVPSIATSLHCSCAQSGAPERRGATKASA